MGQFAINVAISYDIGSSRGDRSVLSAMDIERHEFFANFGHSVNDLILSHREDLERKRKWTRQEFKPKTRWVDGTPEYSFYICGLRKLFPSALFIHIVRDVNSVVRSMLNFHRLGAGSLVATEQEAYNYWLRTVNSCLLAERAYGPGIVFRLRYSDLINTPEEALRASFNFLNEPFVAECLDPLQKRINTSDVSPDFKLGDPKTDPILIEQARRLNAEIEAAPQPPEASAVALDEIEAAFNERVHYVATVDAQYSRAQQTIIALQQEYTKSIARE